MIKGMTIIVICAVVGLPVFIACGSKEVRAEKALKKIEERYPGVLQNPSTANADEFQKAVADLRGFIAAYPAWRGSASVQYAIGHLHVGRNDLKNALEELPRVYMNYPERGLLCAQARFLIGVIYEKQGDWKSALKEFREITERYPTSPQGFNVPLYIAEHYRKNNRQEEFEAAGENAVRTYLDLIAFDPRDNASALTALNGILATCERSGKWRNGARVLETLAEKHPDCKVGEAALFRAAMVYRTKLSQPEQALATLRKFTARYGQSEQYKDAVFGIAALLASSGRLDEARNALNALREKYKDDRSLGAQAQIATARAYERSGNYEAALREYRAVSSRYPDTVESLEACLLIARNERYREFREETLGRAVENGRRLLKKTDDKREMMALVDLVSTACFLQGKWQEGVAVLKALARKNPDDEDVAPLAFKIGTVYYRELNDPVKARYYFALLIRKHPGHALALNAQKILAEMDSAPTPPTPQLDLSENNYYNTIIN